MAVWNWLVLRRVYAGLFVMGACMTAVDNAVWLSSYARQDKASLSAFRGGFSSHSRPTHYSHGTLRCGELRLGPPTRF